MGVRSFNVVIFRISFKRIIRYEMLYGLPPFYNREQNQQLTFRMIREADINFSTKVNVSDAAKTLIVQVIC